MLWTPVLIQLGTGKLKQGYVLEKLLSVNRTKRYGPFDAIKSCLSHICYGSSRQNIRNIDKSHNRPHQPLSIVAYDHCLMQERSWPILPYNVTSAWVKTHVVVTQLWSCSEEYLVTVSRVPEIPDLKLPLCFCFFNLFENLPSHNLASECNGIVPGSYFKHLPSSA